MEKIDFKFWEENQVWEKEWWKSEGRTILETSSELSKQNVYADILGLKIEDNFIDLKNKSVIDLGCGPVSLLLRSKNFSFAYAVEPNDYGDVVNKKYIEKNINLIKSPIENLKKEQLKEKFDELWMYNVLEHVISPKECLEKILELCPSKIRIFEWLDIPPHQGHPFLLTEELFVKNLNLTTEEYEINNINKDGCVGKYIKIIKDL